MSYLNPESIYLIPVKLKECNVEFKFVSDLDFESFSKKDLTTIDLLPYLLFYSSKKEDSFLIHLLELGYDKYEDLDPELHGKEIEYFLKVKKKWELLNPI